MANNLFNYIFKITSNAQNVTGDMGKLRAGVDRVEAGVEKMGKSFDESFDKIHKGINTIKLDAILNQVDRVADAFNSLNGPGLDLNANMQELQAMTGLTGDKLKEIEGYARRSGIAFGTGASGGVESYKLLLGQLTPEIAKVPKALESMGKSVGYTSKLMGGDQVAATEVLTTAMNQYGVSLDDPIKASEVMAQMMNVMAAAAGEGSAELPAIKQALEQSGMAAKGAKVSFEETNAAIQVLDKAGKKGSEGGIALRNVMSTLSQGRFLPKNVQAELLAAGVNVNKLTDTSKPLTERLRALNPIMHDSALVSALFGKENSNAAMALMGGVDEVDRLTKAISGTNTAQEQAAIIMESQAEKNARLKAQVDDFKISLFNATNGVMGYATVLGDVSRDVANLIPLFTMTGNVLSTLTSKQKLMALWTSITSGATAVWTGIQAAFNAVMMLNPIVWIVLAVIALVAAIVIVAQKTEGWGKAWDHTVKGAKLLWESFTEGAKWGWNTLVNNLMIGLNKIKAGWYEFKNATGLGDEAENNKALAEIHADTEARKKAITDGAKKVVELGLKSAEEFKLAAQSVKWKEGAEKADGIAPVGMPGAGGTGGGKGGMGGGANTSKANTAIATGGTKNTTINITLGELIGIKANSVSGSKDTIDNIGKGSLDALVRTLAMATTAAE